MYVMKPIKYLLIVTLVALVSGCGEDQHLNLSPLTELSEGTFYNNQQELEQAVNDVYRQLSDRLAAAHSVADLYGELYSDNTSFVFQTGGDPVDEAISGYILRANNSRLLSAWNSTYNAIYICNNVIEQVENTPLDIDADLKARWIAEAKVVRALAYFNLVRAFGGVPLVTERITTQEAYNYLRESPDVIYEQLIADLTSAKQALPPSYSGVDVGRITQYGVAAILAKIHLTRGDEAAARSELEFIINSGQFSLDANGDGFVDVEDYRHIFAPDTKNSRASILEAQYLAGIDAANSDHQDAYMPFHHAFNLPGVEGTFRGEGVNTPSPDLRAEFEEGDPRLETSIQPGYINVTTGEFVEYPFTFKFFDPNWLNPGQNFELIRYADILLMYAEVTDDPQYLNAVRERVGLPPFGSAEYPSDLYPTLELAIEHERRVELTHEFHRMFDLVRTGRAVEVLQGKGFDFDSNELLFPIPQDAIDVNPDLTQNPGY